MIRAVILAIFYHLGWAIERYNIRNEIGERFAQYPLHGIDAVGSVRHDKISYGLQLSSDVQVNHPGRRHLVTASPFVTVQLGTHVDLNLSFSITQREFPAPTRTRSIRRITRSYRVCRMRSRCR